MSWIDDYNVCSVFVTIIASFVLITSFNETRKHTQLLKEMADLEGKNYVTVYDENGETCVVDSENLIPGDIIAIPSNGCVMSCDALLLTGMCIVNECALTGESTPATKIPAKSTNDTYDPKAVHARHTLYCGSTVIQTRYYHHKEVKAIVVRTGVMTAKGELIRSRLFMKVAELSLKQDTRQFIGCMALVAVLGCSLLAYIDMNRGSDLRIIIDHCLELITLAISPALQAALTIGTIYAQRRLKKKGIFCTTPAKINVGGGVKLVCFDKTGTLTEEGLSLWEVLMSNGKCLVHIKEKLSTLSPVAPLLCAMGTCHSLVKINGELCGDPLDLVMFKWTNWSYYQCEYNGFLVTKTPYVISVLKQFPFASNFQCMSVITKTVGSSCMTVYTKGAPEKVFHICNPDTVPGNVHDLLVYYTSLGHRVVAIATKQLPKEFTLEEAMKKEREMIEDDLTFLGLLLIQNSLKPLTTCVIRELKQACIKCVMLTGDNLLTAVTVGVKCELITPTAPILQVVISSSSPYAVEYRELKYPFHFTKSNSPSALIIDGPTWNKVSNIQPDLLPFIAKRGVIFARMSPQQKAHVIKVLQSLDQIVLMVGDGANDYTALKTANIGISLSSTKASIAAPFTSTVPDVTCVPKLIAEGRCSLVTSVGIFNYTELNCTIQFVSVIILRTLNVEIDSFQFLYIDFILISTLAVVMGRLGPSDKLVSESPLTRLTSPANIVPLSLHIILSITIQCLALFILRLQPWFIPVNKADGNNPAVESWENTTIFLMSCFQYVVLAIAFSKGRPHHEPIYKNCLFMTTVILLITVNSVILFIPGHFISNYVKLVNFSDESLMFRIVLITLAVVQLIFALLIERIEYKTFQRTFFGWFCKRKLKEAFRSKYKPIETHICNYKAYI